MLPTLKRIDAAIAEHSRAANARNAMDSAYPPADDCPECEALRDLRECVALDKLLRRKGWDDTAKAIRRCAYHLIATYDSCKL